MENQNVNEVQPDGEHTYVKDRESKVPIPMEPPTPARYANVPEEYRRDKRTD
jgi:hypothetical protein